MVEEVGKGLIGFAALAEEPIYLRAGDQRLMLCKPPGKTEEEGGDGLLQVQSALIIRILDKGQGVCGVVEVYNKVGDDVHSFLEQDANRVMALANHLTGVVRLARLLEDWHKMALQMRLGPALRNSYHRLLLDSLRVISYQVRRFYCSLCLFIKAAGTRISIHPGHYRSLGNLLSLD